MDKTQPLTSRSSQLKRKRNVDRQPRLRILRTVIEARVECHRSMKERCVAILGKAKMLSEKNPHPHPRRHLSCYKI